MVIDVQVVITGSFNFTKAAEQSNSENLLVIRDKAVVGKYTANWEAHAKHSEPYGGREQGFSETPGAAAEAKVDSGPAAQEGFVASANSSVFHQPGCKSAAKIAEKNLVRYASREEAVRAGKRPCAECRP